ncbi:MAG: leucine-rich repeat protein [Clostridia bacterium]
MKHKKHTARRMASGALALAFVLALSPSAVVSATAEELPPAVRSAGQMFKNVGSKAGAWLMQAVDQISNQNIQSATALAEIFTGNSTQPDEIAPLSVESGDFYYTVLDDGTAEITDYTGSVTELTIPAEIDGYRVTSIGDSAFNGCSSLTNITIPSGVTSIGDGAFYYCSSLTNITIPSGVTSIGDNAFNDCSSLTNITIPSSVTSIGDGAFYYCSLLTNITIPSGVTSIGDSAFEDCGSLIEIEIPSGVTSIGDSVFRNCSSLTNITIPSGVTSIGDSVFRNCSSLTNITIPSGVTSIGDSAFEDCGSLIEIEIPSGVTSIGDSVFRNCSSLTNITIPSGVTSIGYSAFRECDSLTNITIPSSVTSIGDSAFEDCGSLIEIEIPSGVTSIGDSVFRNCYSLTNITIPSGVTSIGDHAFWCCHFLTNITIPSGVTSIGDHAFLSCYSLTNITIPSGVTSIEDGTFWSCYSLTNITIPSGVTSIGDSAFSSCNSLTNITIPSGVTSIGDSAFEGCESLANIIIPNNVENIGKKALAGCNSLTDIKVGLNNPYYSDINGVLYSKDKTILYQYPSGKKDNQYTIPSGVTSIRHSAFQECYSLTNITIPSGVTSIGDTAFWECDSLTNITIPSSVTSMGVWAFSFCDSLTDIYYEGSEDEWNSIFLIHSADISSGVTIHYNGGSLTIGTAAAGLAQVSVFDRAGLGEEGLFYSSKLNQVTVTSGSNTQQFDGTATLPAAYSGHTAVFARAGYRDYIVPAEVLATWYTVGGASVTNVYLDRARSDGKPYISTVFARGTGEEDYVELQSQSMTAMGDEAYDLILSAGQTGGQATYYLSQDDATRISSPDGRFDGAVLADVFKPGKDVYAYVLTPAGASEAVKLKLSVTDAKLPKDSFSMLGKDSFKIKFDQDTPLIGGAEIKMDGFNFPIGVEVTGDRIRISFGIDVFSASKGSSGSAKTEFWKNFKKSVCTINESVSNATDKLKEFKKFYETFAPNQGYLNKTKNFDVGFLGYAEGTIVNGTPVFTEFSGEIATKFMFKYTQQGTIWIIPVYGSITAGVTAAIQLQRIRALPDSNLPFDFGFKLKLEPELDLGLGVGVKGAISGGVYGKGSIPFENDFTAQHTFVQLSGEIGIEGELFCFSGKKSLLDGTLTIWDKYYGSSKKAALGVNSTLYGKHIPQQQTVTAVIPRDYLAEMSGWLDGKAYRKTSRSSVGSGGLEIRELQTSVFKNTQTELVALDDGRMMMAWIEDDPERDAYNRLRLVYSVWENGVWSQPKAVADDGTNDGYPALATDGKNIFIAWQNVNRLLTEEDADSIDAILTGSEICIAQYDNGSDSFINQKVLTNNAVYDYSPVLAVDNGTAILYWLHNDANDLTKAGSTTIYSYSSSSGMSAPVLTEANYILDMDCSAQAGEVQLAYSMDQDGDVSTTDDIKVYALAGGDQIQCTPAEQMDESADFAVAYGMLDGTDTLFFADSDNIYYFRNGVVHAVFRNARAIHGDLQILEDGETTGLMWTESSESGTELWMCMYSDGIWSEPVQLTETGAMIHDVDAVYCNGMVYGVFGRTERVQEGESYTNGSTDLCFMSLTNFVDLEAGFSTVDESRFIRGKEALIPVYLKNNGTKTIDQVTITLTDTLGTEVSVEKNVSLPSGGEKIVEIAYPVPQNYARTTLGLQVHAASDVNTADNSDSYEVGYADISIGEMKVEEVGQYFVLTAILSNDNPVTADPVTVHVRSGSREGEILESIEVGTMQPGELRSVQYIINRDSIEYDGEQLGQLYFVAEIGAPLSRAANGNISGELLTADNAVGAILQQNEAGAEVLHGDIDQDGVVTAADARLALQATAGNRELTLEQAKAADVNGDGIITSIDARWILQISTGIREIPDVKKEEGGN